MDTTSCSYVLNMKNLVERNPMITVVYHIEKTITTRKQYKNLQQANEITLKHICLLIPYCVPRDLI